MKRGIPRLTVARLRHSATYTVASCKLRHSAKYSSSWMHVSLILYFSSCLGFKPWFKPPAECSAASRSLQFKSPAESPAEWSAESNGGCVVSTMPAWRGVQQGQQGSSPLHDQRASRAQAAESLDQLAVPQHGKGWGSDLVWDLWDRWVG